MDNRLSLYGGQRISRLRQEDLPTIAYVLTAILKRHTKVGIQRSELTGPPLISFTSDVFHVSLLLEDWQKIEPYVKEGFFNTVQYPVAQAYPESRRVPEEIRKDPLYSRILSVLTLEFPDSYPTT